ncbi:hypothetical protein CYY_006737 [Polysphondylium violaceum]|uniref:Uncharacterized protein n=1 Tax=Polysphondylium violaceum TaxID=133409 RepID=A0A8J4PQ47_9MYCE|nr:hypothetical protein CYY_006737 [Polysphondylium violaceum]
MSLEENSNIVWYVTGSSKGMGLCLVKKLLQQGYKVAATTRDKDALWGQLNNDQPLTDDQVGSLLILNVDLTSDASVLQSINDTVAKFKRIDNVVNNAGYGLFGPVEECSPEACDKLFKVNVHGPLNVVRNVLPVLRSNKDSKYRPRIYNISSMVGFYPSFAGTAIYATSKFALNGLSQAMSTELEPLGIFVTSVLPGQFRTNFLQQDSGVYAETKIEDYKSTIDSLKERHKKMNGLQPGDPDKAMQILIELSKDPNPPRFLPLGKDSVEVIEKQIATNQNDIDRLRSIITDTDFK